MKNVFLAYAVRSMKKHRSRTVVTVIGLMTAMALFTAVTEGAYSGIRYFRNSYAYTDGSFQAAVIGLDPDDSDAFTGDPEIDECLTMQEIGWAQVQTDNEYKPYLRIVSGPPDSALLPVHISYGRLPENQNEIILPDPFLLMNSHTYKQNEVLDLSVGTRELVGKSVSSLDPYDLNETLAEAREHTYTVTGFYDRFCDSAEPREASYYTAITKSDETDGISDVYYTMKDIHQLPDLEKTLPSSAQCTRHKEILMVDAPSLSGASSRVLNVVYGFAAALILIVVIGAVSLICNSFSISVAERTKDYGILRSIGASRRQIRSTVFSEAVLTSLLGMIPGVLIGIIGIALTLHFTGTQISSLYADSPVQIRFAFSWKAALISCIICLLTALISAWIPAGRAVRISPMEAVRSTGKTETEGRLKIRRKADRRMNLTCLLTRRNAQRFAARNRSTNLSLVVSMVLLVSASVLVGDLQENIRQSFQDSTGDIGVNMHEEDSEKLNAVYQKIRSLSQIEDGKYAFSAVSPTIHEITVNDSLVSKAYKENNLSKSDLSEAQDPITTQELYFLDDETFRRILKAHGLQKETYFDADHPQGILFNEDRSVTSGKENTVQMIDASVTGPFAVQVMTMEPQEGLIFDDVEKKDGDTLLLYYREAYLESLSDDESPDPHEAVEIPAADIVKTNDLVIGAAVNDDETLTGMFSGVTVVYPASAYPALQSSAIGPLQLSMQGMSFETAHPEKAEEEIRTILQEENLSNYSIINFAKDLQEARSMVTVIRVFSDAFVILTACIAIANVLNTVMTGMQLRRKEFAMLRSVGMTHAQFGKMFRKEILLTASRSIFIAVPVSIMISRGIWRLILFQEDLPWKIPWISIILTSVMVLVILSIAMHASWCSIAKQNLSEELRSEIV